MRLKLLEDPYIKRSISPQYDSPPSSPISVDNNDSLNIDIPDDGSSSDVSSDDDNNVLGYLIPCYLIVIFITCIYVI